MKIVIVSIGTRGDVQPSVVLGQALLKRGHDVVVATEERLRPLVDEMMGVVTAAAASQDDDDETGVEVTPSSSPSVSSRYWRLIEGDETGILYQPKIQEYFASRKVLKVLKAVNKWKKRFDEQSIIKSYVSALEGADVVVASPLCMTRAMIVAESMGAGFVCLIPGPTLPTSEFPLWAISVPFSCMNKWSYHFFFDLLWKQERKGINAFRQRELNLPPMTTGPNRIIEKYGFPVLIASSVVTCGPKMVVPSDYPPCVSWGIYLPAGRCIHHR